MRWLIDPAVADLQAEYADARLSGSRWRTLWALCAGYVAITKVLGIAGCGELADALHGWHPDERAAARGGAWVACVGGVALTFVLAASQFRFLEESLPPTLALYLIPSVVPLSLPFGCALGLAWAFTGAGRTRKLAVCALAFAFICSAGMFANFEWLLPETNQAFREHVFARAQSPGRPTVLARGVHELNRKEARQRRAEMAARSADPRLIGAGLDDEYRLRRFDVDYYRKWGLTGATFAIVALVLSLGARRRWTRGGLTGAALATCAAYYALLMSASAAAIDGAVPAIVAGWSANAVCVVAALLLVFSSRARSEAASPAP